ncbi:hypothetical protein BC828DRAFT_150230 [Blastocladiella britannica]|nr:hypothetical protein BC828DRAFT_150230 [Blastocladiella britannica]
MPNPFPPPITRAKATILDSSSAATRWITRHRKVALLTTCIAALVLFRSLLVAPSQAGVNQQDGKPPTQGAPFRALGKVGGGIYDHETKNLPKSPLVAEAAAQSADDGTTAKAVKEDGGNEPTKKSAAAAKKQAAANKAQQPDKKKNASHKKQRSKKKEKGKESKQKQKVKDASPPPPPPPPPVIQELDPPFKIEGGFTKLNPYFSFLSRERGNFDGINGGEAPRSEPLVRKRGLLAMPVSFKAQRQVAPVLAKFRDEGFDVMFFHFDDSNWSDVPGYKESVSIRVAGQTKLWYAKRFLTPMVVENYDYIFLWDDDVGMDADWSPTKFVAIMQYYNIHVAQPSLRSGARKQYPQYNTVRWHPEISEGGSVGRFTQFIELMFPVYSREAWQNCIWETLPYDGRSYWGIDNVWYPHCSSIGYCRFAVIDAMPVDHLNTQTLTQRTSINLRELGRYLSMYKEICKPAPPESHRVPTYRVFKICFYMAHHRPEASYGSIGTIEPEKHGGSEANARKCAEGGSWGGISNKPWQGGEETPAVPYPYTGVDTRGPVGGIVAEAKWTGEEWDKWFAENRALLAAQS